MECLISVAIIGVLIALISPAAKGWLTRAHGAKCLANLRSVGQATLGYASENNGRLPSPIVSSMDDETRAVVGSSGNDRLMMAIYPYVRNAEIFQCPVVMAENPPSVLTDGRYNSTYNQNAYTFARPIAALPSASNMILVYEGYPYLNFTGTPPEHQMSSAPVSSAMRKHPSSRAGVGSMNALMVDGSARQDLYYIGWGNPENTLPANGGIWSGL